MLFMFVVFVISVNSRTEILNYSICLLLMSFTIILASEVLLVFFPPLNCNEHDQKNCVTGKYNER